MAFRTTPQLGPQLDDVYTGLPYWDMGMGVGTADGIDPEPSPKLGTRETGSDGFDYIWVQASAGISSGSGNGTQVAITSDYGAAAGSGGGWYAPPGVAITEQYFWARQGALFAAP